MIADYEELRARMGAGSATLEGGRVLADYRLVREIGRGGMSVVWEAEQISLQRRVALKFLASHYALSTGAQQRFEREARAGGRLVHVGIVQTLALGQTEGLNWIAQELVPGGYTLADSLADLREARELPDAYYADVARLFARIAEALDYAHEQGVVHRDIKPSNVLLTDQDDPKVADFGLARIQDECGLSRTGELEGTPHYMSPEQVAAKRIGIDHRTDVFSLGAALYEALTLSRAFDGDTSQHVFRKILTVDPPDPRTLRSRVPRDLAVVCLHALEKDPARRYATMGEFAADLRHFLRNEPIRAHPPGALARAVKWTRRHPALSLAGGTGAVALAVVTLLFLLLLDSNDEARRKGTLLAAANEELRGVNVELEEQKRRIQAFAEEQTLRAERETERAQAEARRAYAANLRTARLALSEKNIAEARRALDACPADERGWEWGHTDLVLRQVAPIDEALPRAFAFSPSGKWLAIGRSDGTVRLWDTATATPHKTLGETRRAVRHFAFDRNERRLVTVDEGGELIVWNVAGSVELDRLPDPVSLLGVRFDSTGGRIIYVSTDGEVRAWRFQPYHHLPSGSIRVGSETVTSPEPEVPETLLRIALDSSPESVVHLGGEAWPIAVGASDGKVRLYWPDRAPRTLFGLRTSVEEAHVARDGRRVVARAAGETVVWDTASGEELARFSRDDRTCTSLAFGSDGAVLFGMRDGAVEIRGGADSREALFGHAGPIEDLISSAGGRFALTRAKGSELRLWRLDRKEQLVLDAAGRATCVAFSRDGQTLFAGLTTPRVRSWKTNGALLGERSAAGGFLRGLSPSPDGTLLAGVRGHPVQVWSASGERDAGAGAIGRDGGTFDLAFGPGERVVTAAYDGAVDVWASASGPRVATLQTSAEAGGELAALAASPAGRWLACGRRDGTVRVWDGQTLDDLVRLDGHERHVVAASFSSDGALLATASEDGTARVWRTADWKLSAVLRGHVGAVNALAFAPAPIQGGARIATAGKDGTVRVWDAFGGEELAVLRGHGHVATSVAFSPDGTQIASSSYDETVRIWRSRPFEGGSETKGN